MRDALVGQDRLPVYLPGLMGMRLRGYGLILLNKTDLMYRQALLEMRKIEIEFFPSSAKDNEEISPDEQLRVIDEELAFLVSEADRQGVAIPLSLICERFSLTEVERRILLISQFAFFDPAFMVRFGLQASQGPSLFSLGFLEETGLFDPSEMGELRRALSREATLVRYGLVGIHSNISTMSSDIFLYGRRRVSEFLMGEDGLDPSLADAVDLLEPPELISRDSNSISDLYDSVQESWVVTTRNSGRVPVFLFSGPSEPDKKRNALQYCAIHERRLLVLHLNRLLLYNSGNLIEFILYLQSEMILLNAFLYVKFEPEQTSDKSEDIRLKEDLLLDLLRDLPGPVFISARDSFFITDGMRRESRIDLYEIFFDIPDRERRSLIWREALNGSAGYTLATDPGELGRKYRFTEEQILTAVRDARTHSLVRKESGGLVNGEDIHQVCQKRNFIQIPGVIKKIETNFDWSDLILPEDHIVRLKELSYHLKHSDCVYDAWGFQGKSTMGRGIHVLFSGRSGTGKTMAAGVIAKETGLDLYRIDLAGVVSKYIGETEKNLSRIFSEAQGKGAILFFDEADALFGKRSEVKDAKDRYSNIEVAYLLQKIEEYNGMTILATNLASNLDEAFLRRLHFIIEFPMPDRYLARKIWERSFPENAPLSEDLDFDFLSNEIQFSGGSIINVALNAAFFAAEDESAISMRHVMRSVRREYQKTGKPFGKEDMKKYFEMAMGQGGH